MKDAALLYRVLKINMILGETVCYASFKVILCLFGMAQ